VTPRPQPPTPPELEDCCRSGCVPCVFDLYEDALERYRIALRKWKDENGDSSEQGPDDAR
jgi:hypothetical protein